MKKSMGGEERAEKQEKAKGFEKGRVMSYKMQNILIE